MRRSTVQSLPFQLVFPGSSYFSPDLEGYGHVGSSRTPDDVGALLERVIAVRVVG
jgi:hypothetical protein